MKKDWIWMPHAGHFICSAWCRFRLNTFVNGYIVSTVGEYVPDEPIREITCQVRGIKLEGQGDARLADWLKKCGYEELGLNRRYETMVFKAKKSGKKCCPYVAKKWAEIDSNGYNNSEDAYKGHLAMCRKYAKAKEPSE